MGKERKGLDKIRKGLVLIIDGFLENTKELVNCADHDVEVIEDRVKEMTDYFQKARMYGVPNEDLFLREKELVEIGGNYFKKINNFGEEK